MLKSNGKSVATCSRASELLQQVEDSISNRIDELQSLMLLRVEENSSAKEEIQKKLVRASNAVDEVELLLKKLKAYCSKESTDLERTKELFSRIEGQSRRLTAIDENVPRHLPKTHQSNETNSDGNDGTWNTEAHNLDENLTNALESDSSQCKRGSGTRGSATPSHPEIKYLTASELKSAPQYVVGRLTLEKVNDTVNVLNRLIRDKYQLLRRPMRELSSKQLNQVQAYQDEELSAELGNSPFISSNDIKACPEIRPAATAKSILNLLRHCKRIREVRSTNSTRIFIVL
ncbi:hypothetical protein NDN08_000590 [Rhodosorus marinus]|uniref:Spindle and kinetochore-associated protein 1 n=1 Tax=Rhodosorus marinus TaxID=101924 RepID=A0AAV8UU28_9RHOD|nr:hypothetical protein NDN08_000590 [Rhodosorus marinus]